jgi:carbamoyl-phosphate synthase, small subunit
MQQALLLLQDGTLFRGKAFGHIGTTSGEICFNTGMTGYQEVFTDPSYCGQLLVMNSVHIGNYGTNLIDTESDGIKIEGLIARNLSDRFSRPMAVDSLDHYLKANQLVAIHQIDTRALVSHIRQKGAMNAIISSETNNIELLKGKLAATPSMSGLDLSDRVTTPTIYTLGDKNSPIRIAVLDLGVKKNILTSMVERGAHITVYPKDATIEQMISAGANAFFVSNGPGDPAAMPDVIKTVQQMTESGLPTFGICLGHQLIALANGATTFKMHHGHRGLNHPVKNLETGISEITTQNHGFGVEWDSVSQHPELAITHINLNDHSLEGMRMKHKPVFSVQYHPEASPGPHDARYLFDQFIQSIQAQL